MKGCQALRAITTWHRQTDWNGLTHGDSGGTQFCLKIFGPGCARPTPSLCAPQCLTPAGTATLHVVIHLDSNCSSFENARVSSEVAALMPSTVSTALPIGDPADAPQLCRNRSCRGAAVLPRWRDPFCLQFESFLFMFGGRSATGFWTRPWARGTARFLLSPARCETATIAPQLGLIGDRRVSLRRAAKHRALVAVARQARTRRCRVVPTRTEYPLLRSAA
jgi:hypothetical protein